MQIRSAIAADLPKIKSFDEMGGDRKAEIDSGLCLVADVGGELVGYASYSPAGLLGQPLLTFLCVAASHRRQGIASKLVAAVQARVRGRKLISSTEDWCVETQRIFERLGWQRIGELSAINKDGSAEIFYAIELRS